ncbi:cation diffusion zinc membrane transporter Zrg17 [Clarireedia jacksonii]
MASSLPIPRPPRTPTPPTPLDNPNRGVLGGDPQNVHDGHTFDPNALSPSFPPSWFGTMASATSAGGLSSPTFSTDGMMSLPPPKGPANPFNFQTQTITDAPVVKSNIGQRRGHRYKHSSVSTQHQIFLEPPPRAPLALPASLPIPTFKEAWKSMSKEQSTRIAWCLCHALISAYVLYSAEGSLALTALSHLIFFDAVSATICVVVDVLCNFEVWKRSSIRHPFGLERAEVLAGFAMSVFLLFMGFDLISHNLKHVLEGLGDHTPHHPHSHQRVSSGSVDSAAVLSIVATLVSAIGLKNHARIGKAMRFAYISFLPSVLSNPSHFLTLSCSTIMLLLPHLTISMYIWLDRLLCTVIAVSMFLLGVRLATAQGLMLLMSYSGAGVSDVVKEIESEPSVSTVEEARFWQVHYGLCMANLKLRVRGDEGSLLKLRERIRTLIRNRLGEGYGKGSGVKWEVTTQLIIDGK